MNLTENIKFILTKTITVLATDIKAELTKQGHIDTGKLANSMTVKKVESGDTLSVGVEMEDYYGIVESGVKRFRIPFGGRKKKGNNKKKSEYIKALIEWWERKGKNAEKAKSAAFATAKKHKEEGMPSRNSYKFSKNGRRLKFIQESTNDSPVIKEMEVKILDSCEDEMQVYFNQMQNEIA